MSWRDRPYSDDDGGYAPGGGELRIQFRRPSTIVTWLVIINVAVFFLQLIWNSVASMGFDQLFGLSWSGLASLRIWQLATYMFVHDPRDIFHILFNMLLLYFVGSEIERGFGRERFLRFYFLCGLIGGLAYLVLGVANSRFAGIPLVGASGAVYGLLMVAMIFYPHMQLVFFVFPMPIRVFGAIMLGIFFFQMITGTFDNLGGDICHLGGALAAVGILYYWGMMPSIRFGSGDGPGIVGRIRKGAWARKQRQLATEQAEVDRILEKVHREGINSLSRRERKILAGATQRQRERDRAAGRIDRV